MSRLSLGVVESRDMGPNRSLERLKILGESLRRMIQQTESLRDTTQRPNPPNIQVITLEPSENGNGEWIADVKDGE
jgi:hypothetical protein